MDDLVQWLRAQLDDDEQMAGHLGEMVGHRTGFERRWLREVEAKRRILDLASFDAQFPDFDGGYESAVEDVLKLLALPYSDRPGYREEWRP